MNYYKAANREMRVFTSAINKNEDNRKGALDKLAIYKGSQHYINKSTDINQEYDNVRKKIKEDTLSKVSAMITEMRSLVGSKITKAPDTEMVNTLSLLNMLDDITPMQMTLYAEQMADSPIAMQALRQIARKHNMRISVPDTELMVKAVDELEDNYTSYIKGFNGADEKKPLPVRQMQELYFRSEENYPFRQFRNVDEADDGFWKDMVGIGSQEVLDDSTSKPRIAEVKHFFEDMDGMMKYIEQHTAGLDKKAKEQKEKEILADCPALYQARYKYYLENGEKLPINGEDLVTNE